MASTESFPAEAAPVTVDQAIAKAQEFHRVGQLGPASAIYRRVLEAIPDHGSALHFLGVAEFQAGRSEEAIALIRRALLVDPDYADAHNNLGNVHRLRGDLVPARQHYERALALRPENPEVHNNLGTILRAERRFAEALALFERAVELWPEHVEAHHNRGNVLLALHRHEEALASFQRALMLRPYDRDSHRRLGIALYACGRLEEATSVYRRWAELQPDDPEARHMLAAATGEAVPPRASNEAMKVVFDAFASSFDAVLERLEYRAPTLVAEAVAEMLGAPARDRLVLDAGCGTGLAGPLLRPYAERLVGLDLSDRMIEAALQRGMYDEFFVGDLTAHLGRHPAAYDLVASIDTLVYFGDIAPVVEGLGTALRPGGHVVFTVERADPDVTPHGFRLNPHGRYAHTERYLRDVLARGRLAVVTFREVVLRKETGHPVHGYLVCARMPPR